MIKKLYRREAQRRKHKDTQRDLTRNFAKLCEIFGVRKIYHRETERKSAKTRRGI